MKFELNDIVEKIEFFDDKEARIHLNSGNTFDVGVQQTKLLERSIVGKEVKITLEVKK